MTQVEYGFERLKDRFKDKITEVGVPVIDAAINRTIDEHNRQIEAFEGLFVDPTTDYKRRYRTVGRTRNQPLDEFGRALPMKVAGHYDIAFPLYHSGNAWGETYLARERMTVGDANKRLGALLLGDTTWYFDQILAGLTVASAWTFDDEEHGALSVQPLANNDSTLYLLRAGHEAPAQDNHLLFWNNVIADATNPFPSIYKDVMEHPENSGELICLVASDLVPSILNLATLLEPSDANITEGSGVSRLTGQLPGIAVPGIFLGYERSKVWIYEWPRLPSKRIVAVATGGDRSLCKRQFEEPSLQGFRKVAERNDHPFYESQYFRSVGIGAQNRVNALVMQVESASYNTPTAYVDLRGR